MPRVVMPICRPVEANEAATQAIEAGIPETAVLVIGGLMVPWKSRTAGRSRARPASAIRPIGAGWGDWPRARRPAVSF